MISFAPNYLTYIIMNYINKHEAVEIIKGTKGKFLSVKFIKKNGDKRTLVGRNGVRSYLKGGELKYSPEERGYIVLWCNKAKNYRMVNTNTITELNVNKQKYLVK